MDIQCINQIYKQMSQAIFTEEILLKTDPITNSIKTIKEISSVYDIYIITARTEQLISYVKKWLQKNDIDKDIKGIISSSYKEKQEICKEKKISCLYDDDIRHLKKEIIKNRILFNQDITYKDVEIRQVNSWNQIKQELLPIKS